MNELLQSEIVEILSRHRIVESRGWSRTSGVVEYECACGVHFLVDTRCATSGGRDAQLTEHQALELRSLGLRRTEDQLDATALQVLASEILRRRKESISSLAGSHATSTEIARLEGAVSELNGFAALIEGLSVTRANHGNADLFVLRPDLAWDDSRALLA